MQLTAGSAYTGTIEQYHEITGFILAQKPASIRVIGQVPVVGKNIFDMESDGKTFRYFCAVEKSIYCGPGKPGEAFRKADRKSAAATFNRCDILAADSGERSGSIRGSSRGQQELLCSDRGAAGEFRAARKNDCGAAWRDWEIDRKIWFDRTDLNIHKDRDLRFRRENYLGHRIHGMGNVRDSEVPAPDFSVLGP